MSLVAGLALMLVGIVHQAASYEEWTRVLKCAGEQENGLDRLDYKVSTVLALAQIATRVRICNVGNAKQCSTSVAGSFPILMLRQGRTISHNGTTPCDTACVAATWTGTQNIYLWSNATPAYVGTNVLYGSQYLLYGAANNGNGLHMQLSDGGFCRWNWNTASDNNIEVFLDIPAPPITEPYQYANGSLNYHLVAVTNYQRTYGYGATPVDWHFDPSDPAVGDYVKPVPGTYTRLRYECGYRLAGVLGYIELNGTWEWPVGGLLAAATTITKVETTFTFDPQLPGYIGDADWAWSNVKWGYYWPTVGIEGFKQVDGNYREETVWTCNPYGTVTDDMTTWAPSGFPDDIRFVRLWLASPAPAPHYSFVDSTSGLNYTLVAVTNGAATNPRASQIADSSDPTVGEYVKPLYGVFKRLRYECGYQTAGVLGVVELAGIWTWAMGNVLAVSGTASVVTSNALWAPKLPGYAGDGDQPWANVKSTVRAPTFGMGGFLNVDGRQWSVSDVRATSFACDPQVELEIKLETSADAVYLVYAPPGAQAIRSMSTYTIFKLVPGLADAAAKSLQSVTFPGHYLRDNVGVLMLEADDGTQRFNSTATWWLRPALDAVGSVSFQSFDNAAKYIRLAGNSSLAVTEVAASTSEHADASFNIRYEDASANSGYAWAPSPKPGDVKFIRLWLSADDATTTITVTTTRTTSTTVSFTTTDTTTRTSTRTVTETRTGTRTTTTTVSTSRTTTVSATPTGTTTITRTSRTDTTTSTSSRTTSMSNGTVNVAKEVTGLLQQLGSLSSPDKVTQTTPEANITVMSAAAATELPGGYLHFSTGGEAGEGSVQLVLPPTVAQTFGKNTSIVLVSFSPMSNFAEEGAAPDLEVVASAVSIRVWNDGFQRVAGVPLSSPIVVTLPRPRGRSSTSDMGCAYWDAEAGRWSSEGLVEVNATEDAVVCATTHLTIFAVILKSILAQLECTNVKVLTADGLEKLGSGWPSRPPALLLWALLACGTSWVLYGLWADHRVRRGGLWRDAYYLTYLPEHKRTPLGPAYCAFLAATLVGVCRAAPRRCFAACCARRTQRPALLTALRRWVVTRVTVMGVLSVVAVRNGLSMEEVREHVWGPHGFVKVDMARQCSEQLCRKLDNSQGAIPAAFRDFFTMGFCGRFCLLLRAVHPLCGIGRLALTLSAAKRAKLLVDALLGALVINALFFSATGSAMSIRSPAVCATERLDPVRFIMIGLMSSLLVKVPLMVVAHMHVRAFVHEEHWGPETTRARLRWWRSMDVVFWLGGILWTGFCVFFLVAFLSNLNSKDDRKWVIAFASTVFRMLIVWPCVLALTLSVAAGVLALLQPAFVTHGEPRFGFEVTFAPAHYKVEELAMRSMSVGDLLDFYALLGTKEVMLHFEWDRSTTHDVVRQAIIPLSRRQDLPGGGAAYATVVANGQERLAEKMVTHNWGNKFSHLCAAILADCLGHRNYSKCLEALARGPAGVSELRHKMRAKLHKTYWVCAFCVNQHAGICAAAPPTDSHGYPIEKCTCPHEKYTSGEECEMNKFDDMMAYLKAACPGFQHVIAVDSTFVVFSRIWCVAEILGAFHLRLPQTLKIESQECIDKHKEDLSAFDVRMAESSVPEDKDHILSKVDDKEAFNAQLKDLVLDPLKGLLAMWSASGVMADAASAMLEEGGNVVLQQIVDMIL